MQEVAESTAEVVWVSAVCGREDTAAFVRLPHRLYREDPLWVPPPEPRRFRLPFRRPEPLCGRGEARLFLARRGSRVVGRVAAVRDPRYEEFHGRRHGFFGLFECEDDPAAARVLFDEAAQWLRGFRLDTMVGPVDLGARGACGTLVDGFGRPPAVLTSHNPPYHDRLLRGCGFAKDRDLWAWGFRAGEPPAFLAERAERALARGVTVRPLDRRDLAAELARLAAVYRAAAGEGRDLVPPDREEAARLAARLRPVLRPELAPVAEVDGVPAAFLFALPDTNEAVAAARARRARVGPPLGPAAARAARRVRGLRVAACAVAPPYRGLGLEAALCAQFWRAVLRLGYESVEVSRVREDDAAVNRVAAALGGERYKTYRVYRRALVPRPRRAATGGR